MLEPFFQYPGWVKSLISRLLSSRQTKTKGNFRGSMNLQLCQTACQYEIIKKCLYQPTYLSQKNIFEVMCPSSNASMAFDVEDSPTCLDLSECAPNMFHTSVGAPSLHLPVVSNFIGDELQQRLETLIPEHLSHGLEKSIDSKGVVRRTSSNLQGLDSTKCCFMPSTYWMLVQYRASTSTFEMPDESWQAAWMLKSSPKSTQAYVNVRTFIELCNPIE